MKLNSDGKYEYFEIWLKIYKKSRIIIAAVSEILIISGIKKFSVIKPRGEVWRKSIFLT